MTLLNTIREQQVHLRKIQRFSATDYSVEISLLTTLIGEASAVGKNAQRETTDAETVAVIKKFIKNNDEFLNVAPDAEVFSRLKRENDLLVTFLPEQLTETQLSSIISTLIGEGATNTGEIMKLLKAHHEGRFDGKVASTIAKQLLG